ncbi:hypothetical protein [Aurantimonas sp. 22II-16-19i]|uniref:hypothetical protein n=1 Tax=Aurantimonas sp. 22II-16-19i TaxID=1317114 RepID=UPI00111C237A|nr:hypothetical protein [Aurantimonas sp. 22II-16-19i]
MLKITSVGFGNGSIEFERGIPGTPETVERSGNSTFITRAQPGTPAHFDATFMLVIRGENDGLEFSNTFHLSVPVPNDDHCATYRAIEAEAARLLAPVLRGASEEIDRMVAEFDKNLQEASSQESS